MILCSVYNYVQIVLPVVSTYKHITYLLTLYLTLSPLWSIFRSNCRPQEIIVAENIISYVHITEHQSVKS